jgi:tyrosine-protein kinase Etk/Wzc
MEPKNPSALMAGYQAVGDWLGKRQNRHYLPAAKSTVEIDDEVQA